MLGIIGMILAIISLIPIFMMDREYKELKEEYNKEYKKRWELEYKLIDTESNLREEKWSRATREEEYINYIKAMLLTLQTEDNKEEIRICESAIKNVKEFNAIVTRNAFNNTRTIKLEPKFTVMK